MEKNNAGVTASTSEDSPLNSTKSKKLRIKDWNKKVSIDIKDAGPQLSFVYVDSFTPRIYITAYFLKHYVSL